jgi:hypothetical protein
MTKLKELIKSPHIQIALATGVSIIVMAFVSKRMLSEPIGYVALAIPPFLATIYEALLNRYKNARICTTWYWIAAILIGSALIILFHAV